MENLPLSSRNELFQELKPRCVELSQLALRDDGTQNHAKNLTRSTEQLLNFLENKCRRTDGIFDEKLADYVFFPLSQILRRKQKFTDHLSEVSIKCVKILLEYGWKNSISLDLAKQLLILLTFVAGGIPGQDATPSPEELTTEAYGSLAALFRDLGSTPGGASSLVESGTVPALGHCVTVILDGVVNGPSAEVQLSALSALDAVWFCVKDPQALSSFMPGTVSGLTKCLMPATGTRRSKKTLVKGLEVFGNVLTSLLSDIHTRNIRMQSKPSDGMSPYDEDQKIVSKSVLGTTKPQTTLTKSWLTASSGQIKLALSNVIRLRRHESAEVRKALNRLCITVLDECHDTLSESSSILVETCMTLVGVDAEDDLVNRSTSLVDLATIHPNLSESVKNTIYNWVTSLPRIMQSNDETAKLAALSQLSKAHEMIVGLNLESSILENALGSSLRDSITITLESTTSKALQEEEFDLNSQAAMTLTTEKALSIVFRPIILAEESERKTRKQLTTLLANLGTRQSQIAMASEMLEYSRAATGPSLLSSYWLAAQILRSASSSNEDMDAFFESSMTLSDEQESVNQELFSYSLNVLVSPDDSISDWRMQAIALEVMAETAQHMKEGFRTELVDALYPIAQLLGSSNSQLREHAITSLNIISKSCGYANASELIVDNVDYMVNAISLRLNTFDISPQAPQVLVMMIRLTGPSLLLYLDDVVDSIFAALDNFHGYHRLVEVLFSVLGEIVSVGSKSDKLQIEGAPIVNHKKSKPSEILIENIIDFIVAEQTKKAEDEALLHEDFPHEPWKSAKTLLDEADAAREEADDADPEPEPENLEIEKLPPTKTYNMLQSITRLSQHYLTSSSPVLRSKLLNLIRTSAQALFLSENDFLPLINDIWPVVIQRLYDIEPFVVIAACDTVSELCRCAGDFLSTRIVTEWKEIMRMSRQAKGKVASEKKGKGGRGVYSQNNQVWEAIARFLVAIVGYVRIEDQMFDDVLDVLGELVWERQEVREVMEAINSHAVWLVMQVAGKNKPLKVPAMEGYKFATLPVSLKSKAQ